MFPRLAAVQHCSIGSGVVQCLIVAAIDDNVNDTAAEALDVADANGAGDVVDALLEAGAVLDDDERDEGVDIGCDGGGVARRLLVYEPPERVAVVSAALERRAANELG